MTIGLADARSPQHYLTLQVISKSALESTPVSLTLDRQVSSTEAATNCLLPSPLQ